MRDEIEAGCVAGGLYAESLSLALASYIASRFAVQASDVRRDNGRLSKHQVQRLVEFIQSRIGSELSLTELASVTHLVRVTSRGHSRIRLRYRHISM